MAEAVAATVDPAPAPAPITNPDADTAVDDAEIISLDEVVEPSDQDADTGEDGGQDTGDAEASEASSETEEDADETGDAEDETGDADEDGEDTENEMLEFDFGGNKLEVPKGSVTPELAAKIDEFTKGTWSTFTKGQQDNVERTKSLDAREGTVAKLAALNGEALQTYSYGLQLRSEIAQLTQVDLNTLWQSEPDRARQISDVLGAKQAEFEQVLAKVGEQERAVIEQEQENSSRLVDEGKAYLDKHIKNFTTEKAESLVSYVTETYGMPREQAERWAINPVVTRMAYKAMLFDRQTKAARPTAKPQQAKPVKALPTGSNSTGVERDPDKMTMGQLAKHLELVGA